MKQTISVTRALVELNRLDDRIKQAISNGVYLGRTVGTDRNIKVFGSQDSVEAVSKKIVTSFQSVEQLIKNRAALKSAIVMSNATTKVTVAGKEMTVAEAIELKTSITLKETFLGVLKASKMRESTNVERENAALDDLIQKHLTSIYGSDKSKITDDTVKMVADPQKATKLQAVLDPANISAKIEKLEEEISAVRSELDFTLSEVNAKTTLEVEL